MPSVKRFVCALILIGQLCCSGVYFPILNQFQAYLFLMLFLGTTIMWEYINKHRGCIIVSKGQSFGVAAIGMVCIVIVSMMVNFHFDVGRLVLITCSFLFCRACYDTVNSRADIEWWAKLYLGISFISSLVEIGQVFNIEFCNSLWKMLHDGEKLEIAISAGRHLGLAGDILQFGYQISAAFCIALYCPFRKHAVIKKTVLYAVFAFALLTNNTRSSQIIAVFAICFKLLLTYESKKSFKLRFVKILGIIALSCCVVILFNENNSVLQMTRFGQKDVGVYARIPMFLTAFNHALHNPLGMGVYQVQVKWLAGDPSAAAIVLNATAHNLIGNCVASYGFLGLMVMLYLYVSIFRTFISCRKRIQSDAYVGFYFAMLGLAANACFHNAYILTGELSSFLCFSIILSGRKIIVNSKQLR